MIIEASWGAGTGVGRYAFWLGIFTAFLTAFYSWRLLFMTFHGKSRADAETLHHVHESPQVMLLPLYLLAFGAVFAGMLGYHFFVGDGRQEFWREAILVLPDHDSIAAAEHVPFWVSHLALVVGILGIVCAWVAYIWRPGIPAATARRFHAIYIFLLNKWYFDELYDAVIVRPAFSLGFGLWKKGDGAVIDGLGPDGVSTATLDIAGWASRLQTGYVFHYAFAILIGVVALVSWYLVKGG
jgi:NADH-quinone oxidoreductase subunit L